MNRVKYKSWSNKKPFTRRVIWFQGTDIRLQFEDEEMKINHYFDDKETAQKAFDLFKTGIKVSDIETPINLMKKELLCQE